MQLGIDIGGTTISLGLVRDGAIAERICRPSFAQDATLEETMLYLESLIDELFSEEVDSIGCGVPSVVDVERGIVYDAANIKSWKECHLKETLEAKYKVPVKVNNDSNCYALGAYMSYGGEKPRMMLGITLGTGVGVGVVADGKILSGPHTGVGELGCVPYMEGVSEDYCSSKFFLSQGISPKDAADKALGGDPAAIRLFDEYAAHLGKFLALSLYAYDADIIALGGGVSNGFKLFEAGMLDALNENFVYKNALSDLKVVAMTDDSLAIVGAAML